MFLTWRKKTKISEAAEGKELIVQGQVVARNEITAPGSLTKCVYFSSLNELFTTGSRGRGRKMWVPQSTQKRCAGFFVDDGTSKIWVSDEAEAFQAEGCAEEMGVIGKKGNQRYWVHTIRNGDIVRIKGMVSKSRGSEPGGVLALRPGKKGRIEVLVRK